MCLVWRARFLLRKPHPGPCPQVPPTWDLETDGPKHGFPDVEGQVRSAGCAWVQLLKKDNMGLVSGCWGPVTCATHKKWLNHVRVWPTIFILSLLPPPLEWRKKRGRIGLNYSTLTESEVMRHRRKKKRVPIMGEVDKLYWRFREDLIFWVGFLLFTFDLLGMWYVIIGEATLCINHAIIALSYCSLQPILQLYSSCKSHYQKLKMEDTCEVTACPSSWAVWGKPVFSSVFYKSDFLSSHAGVHKGLPKCSCLAAWFCTETDFKRIRGSSFC